MYTGNAVQWIKDGKPFLNLKSFWEIIKYSVKKWKWKELAHSMAHRLNSLAL